MNEPQGISLPTSELDQSFDVLVCQVSAKLEAGQSVDLNSLADEHPEHLARLRQLLPTLQAMANLGHLFGNFGPAAREFRSTDCLAAVLQLSGSAVQSRYRRELERLHELLTE